MPYKTVFDVTVRLPGAQPRSGPGSRSPAPTAQRKITVENAATLAAAVAIALERIQQKHIQVEAQPREVWANR